MTMMAILLTALACLLFYLGHVNQGWRQRPARGWLVAGLLLWGLALLCWWQAMQAVAAVFGWLVLSMLCLGLWPLFSLLPVSAGYQAGHQRRQRHNRS